MPHGGGAAAEDWEASESAAWPQDRPADAAAAADELALQQHSSCQRRQGEPLAELDSNAAVAGALGVRSGGGGAVCKSSAATASKAAACRDADAEADAIATPQPRTPDARALPTARHRWPPQPHLPACSVDGHGGEWQRAHQLDGTSAADPTGGQTAGAAGIASSVRFEQAHQSSTDAASDRADGEHAVASKQLPPEDAHPASHHQQQQQRRTTCDAGAGPLGERRRLELRVAAATKRAQVMFTSA